MFLCLCEYLMSGTAGNLLQHPQGLEELGFHWWWSVSPSHTCGSLTAVAFSLGSSEGKESHPQPMFCGITPLPKALMGLLLERRRHRDFFFLVPVVSMSVLAHLNTRLLFEWMEKSVLPAGCLLEGSEGRRPSGRRGDPRSQCETGKPLAMQMGEELLL